MTTTSKRLTKCISVSQSMEQLIHVIRGQRVMLDADLAALYGVETRVLLQAVRRNIARFPGDFMFQFSDAELKNWRSQIVTSNPAAKMGLRRPPYAFTEHGVAMLSAVLQSERAVQMSITVIRAFVRLRELMAAHKDIAARVEKLVRGQERAASVIEVLKTSIASGKKSNGSPPRRLTGNAVSVTSSTTSDPNARLT